MAQASMAKREHVGIRIEQGTRHLPCSLYRYVDPNGNLRDYGKRVLNS